MCVDEALSIGRGTQQYARIKQHCATDAVYCDRRCEYFRSLMLRRYDAAEDKVRRGTDEYKATKRAWYLANKDTILARNRRRYRDRHPLVDRVPEPADLVPDATCGAEAAIHAGQLIAVVEETADVLEGRPDDG